MTSQVDLDDIKSMNETKPEPKLSLLEAIRLLAMALLIKIAGKKVRRRQVP